MRKLAPFFVKLNYFQIPLKKYVKLTKLISLFCWNKYGNHSAALKSTEKRDYAQTFRDINSLDSNFCSKKPLIWRKNCWLYVKTTFANVDVLNLLFLPFGALNFFIWWISAFKKCKNSCKSKFGASKCVKTADFELLESPKLISRKILVKDICLAK